MGVKRLCICISKGGYFWNDGGTRLDERWEGGVINPWVDAFTEQYQVHRDREDAWEGYILREVLLSFG